MAMELAKDIKTQDDLADLSSQLLKITVEAALGAEMEDHLSYARHSLDGNNSGNSRNGYSNKILKSNQGNISLSVPRDRNSNFEPIIVSKGETRLTHFDDQILALDH